MNRLIQNFALSKKRLLNGSLVLQKKPFYLAQYANFIHGPIYYLKKGQDLQVINSTKLKIEMSELMN